MAKFITLIQLQDDYDHELGEYRLRYYLTIYYKNEVAKILR